MSRTYVTNDTSHTNKGSTYLMKLRLGSSMFMSFSAYTLWEAVKTTISKSLDTRLRKYSKCGRFFTLTVYSTPLNVT